MKPVRHIVLNILTYFFVFVVVTSGLWDTVAAVSCTQVVPLSTQTVDGKNSPYNALTGGDTLCIASGTRGPLWLQNLKGQSGKPLRIVGQNGTVRIDASSASLGMNIRGSRYVSLERGGQEANGFEVFGSRGDGIRIAGGSSDVSVSYVWVHDVAGIGLQAKTDFSDSDRGIADANGNNSIRDEFTQYNTQVTDSRFERIGKEALYLGSSEYDDHNQDPVLRGVKVTNNTIVDARWDGIQVGSAVSDVVIANNSLRNIGASTDADSGNNRTGMQINPGTTGLVIYNNTLHHVGRRGMYLTGEGNYDVYNNVIGDVGYAEAVDAIRWQSGNSGNIYNNTLVGGSRSGIVVTDGIAAGVIANNIVAGFSAVALVPASVPTVGNTVVPSINSAGFVDSANRNFRLTATSPARNSGSSTKYAQQDREGVTRPQGVGVDAGAYEYLESSGGGVLGDLTGDGRVTSSDLLALIPLFGTMQTTRNIVGSTSIDVFDFNALMRQYGK